MLKLSLFSCLLLSSLDCKPFPQSQTVVDVVCPDAEDGLAVFVPHPSDCSLYYMCVGGSPVLMACHPGLYFDPSLNVCNYPEYVDCQNQETTTTGEPSTTEAPVDSTTAGKETTTSEEPSTTEAAVETTTAGVEETTTEEASEGPSTTQAPVETTTAGVEETTTKEASEGPSTTEASVETITAGVEETTTAEHSTSEAPVDTTTVGAEESTTDAFNVVCPESTDGLVVFVPYPTDCSKYYACHGTLPILMECPPDLFFDPTLNVCNYPEFVDCSSN
eukprot:GFUD01006016.1.p1 GENE.GFUD01006016.1~~GFUD01006016.1.p1  ORF type:complete len:276 (+),score=87.17 GFUD01006016.1:66-893(+)